VTPFQNLSQYEQDCINTARAERGSPPLGTKTPQASFWRPVTARLGVPDSGREVAAFAAGIQVECARSLFALNLRKATVRALQRRAVGSHDPIGCALVAADKEASKHL
jgi:hypothetical protein